VATTSLTTTSFVDIRGATSTFSTGPHRILAMLYATVRHNGNADNLAFGFEVDGKVFSNENSGEIARIDYNANTSGLRMPVMISYITDRLSAASHDFVWRAKLDTGSGTTFTIFNPIATFLEIPY
jgi:hypothetical protein